VRVEDERAPDAERAAEQPGLEHHVVARRRLPGLGRIRRRPVVLGEHERGEIDLLGELDQPVEGRPPRVEGDRPGLDVGNVLEPARDRLEQFGLLARRPHCADATPSATPPIHVRTRRVPALNTRLPLLDRQALSCSVGRQDAF
jgi:hypothetical protein